jgi:hypothetical protein
VPHFEGSTYRLKVFAGGRWGKLLDLTKEEVTGKWIQLRSEELYNVYTLLNIIRIIKSLRIRQAGM